MTELTDLIERVEKASGPDRELDEAVEIFQLKEKAASLGEKRKIVGCLYSAPYTASIDAALTLLPDGYDWILGDVNGHYGGTPYACVGDTTQHFAATPVLALTAACLKARLSRATGEA